MGILKNIANIFKEPFMGNGFIKGFAEKINPPANHQKETAENMKKALDEIKGSRMDMRQGFDALHEDLGRGK